MATITEDYVSFEIAKLLKEKGFDKKYPLIPCYKEDNGEFIDIPTTLDTINYCFIPAPTLQMAMKWLRLNHQIFIRPNTSFLYPIKWYSEIFCYGDNLKTQQDVKTEYYDSPEEACEDSIKYCLEHLI